MAKRSKSGWKAKRHEVKQRWKRRMKRKHEALIAAGHIKKGAAPAAAVAAE